MGVGRGHGKLILFGEHAAVYGQPALGLRLPQYLEVRALPCEPVAGSEHGWILPEVDERAARLISAAIDALPGILGRKPEPHRLQLTGNLPQSVGLGSSAAFCVALLDALAPETFRSRMDLWKAAHALESVFHGTPSGIDTGLSVYPGISLLFPRPPAIPRRVRVRPLEAWIVAGAVPRISSTAALVRGIRERRDEEPERLAEVMKKLGAYSFVAKSSRYFGRRYAEMIGHLAVDAHAILTDLDLAIPAVDEALDLLQSQGSLGGKMSGGGGGGAFFSVFRDEPDAARAAAKLEEWLACNYPLPTGPFVSIVPLRACRRPRGSARDQ